jgi:hypothetical protein
MTIICQYCNKEYSSYSSRSNHVKKYHSDGIKLNDTKSCKSNPDCNPKKVTNNEPKLETNENKYYCKYCGTSYKYKQGKWKHEQKCKIENDNNVEYLKNQLKKKDEEHSAAIAELKSIVLELINKNCKMHPKTLEKMNKQLNSNNVITNSNINSNNTIINNNMIIQLGKEKLYDVFNKQEQINVLNNGFQCLDYLVKYAHFNPKYPQFKNIAITNLQNDIAYKYNNTNKKFEAIPKDELLSEIISERMYDINEFFEKYGNMISSRMQLAIKSFIQKMDSKKYEEQKKKELKIIIYNNKEEVKLKLTTDIEV